MQASITVVLTEQHLGMQSLQTPIGELHVTASSIGVRRVDFECPQTVVPASKDAHAHESNVVLQLAAYFAGELTKFTVPLDLIGTEFQLRVWRVLCGIEFGSTITYAEEAARLGQPRAFRAVGNANGRNPAPIIVPCHRVVASGGGLGGYSAGLDRKRTLLQLESR